MDLIEDKTTPGGKDTDAFGNVLGNLFRCGIRKNLLGVTATSPKGYLITKFCFQTPGVHICGTCLYRVEDVYAGLN